jgi:hypothetical protein
LKIEAEWMNAAPIMATAITNPHTLPAASFFF